MNEHPEIYLGHLSAFQLAEALDRPVNAEDEAEVSKAEDDYFIGVGKDKFWLEQNALHALPAAFMARYGLGLVVHVVQPTGSVLAHPDLETVQLAQQRLSSEERAASVANTHHVFVWHDGGSHYNVCPRPRCIAHGRTRAAWATTRRRATRWRRRAARA